MAFLFDTDEAGVVPSRVLEFANELVGGVPEVIDLTGGEEEGRETGSI